MRTAIIYYSQHHGNTKKLLDAISEADMTVTLINAAEKIEVDLRDYDRIGFAVPEEPSVWQVLYAVPE